MFRRVLGQVCVFSLCCAACGSNATEPTRNTTEPPPPTTSVTVRGAEPAASTTLTRGTPFRLSFTTEVKGSGFVRFVVAFVSDDGEYSPPLACGRVGGSGNGSFAQAVDVAGVIGTDWKGNILHEFGKGRRVNAVLLLKFTTESPTPPEGCEPLGTGGSDPNKPGEGTVYPGNAGTRVDLPLNWLIQE